MNQTFERCKLITFKDNLSFFNRSIFLQLDVIVDILLNIFCCNCHRTTRSFLSLIFLKHSCAVVCVPMVVDDQNFEWNEQFVRQSMAYLILLNGLWNFEKMFSFRIWWSYAKSNLFWTYLNLHPIFFYSFIDKFQSVLHIDNMTERHFCFLLPCIRFRALRIFALIKTRTCTVVM